MPSSNTTAIVIIIVCVCVSMIVVFRFHDASMELVLDNIVPHLDDNVQLTMEQYTLMVRETTES